MAIEFWAHKKSDGTPDENYYLSNFYKAPITFFLYGFNEVETRTSENYFQAMKFEGNTDIMFQILNAKTPREAADLGRSLPGLRKDWEDVKDYIMYEALQMKFTQHKDLREKLLATGDEEIIEASPKDSYWGWGPNHDGKNMLGKLLMKLRKEL